MQIRIEGFADDIVATFDSERSARAFMGAVCEVGSPLTQRETVALADCFGGKVRALPVVTEMDLLAADLRDSAEVALETQAALRMLHELIG